MTAPTDDRSGPLNTDWMRNPVYRIGHCATVAGDPRPWMTCDFDGESFTMSCLDGNRHLLADTPIADVKLITAQGEVCASCRYSGTTVCGLRGAASVKRVAALAALTEQVAA